MWDNRSLITSGGTNFSGIQRERFQMEMTKRRREMRSQRIILHIRLGVEVVGATEEVHHLPLLAPREGTITPPVEAEVAVAVAVAGVVV